MGSALSHCLESLLQKADQRLSDALVAVAAEARSVPGDTYQALWTENLTGFFRTTTDPPAEQAKAFQIPRRKSCAFAKSVGFQGTGFGAPLCASKWRSPKPC